MKTITRRLAPIALVALGWGGLCLSDLKAARAEGSDPVRRPSAVDSLLGAPDLRLDQLVRAVLEVNPTLAAARAAYRESQARADRTGALMNPMLEGMAAPRAVGNQEIEEPGYVVSLSQNFPLFGERGLEKKAARAESRGVGQDLRTTRLDLLQETRRLYWQYHLVDRGLMVNTEIKALLQQFRSVALQKYAAGVVGRQDALQAESELAMLDHDAVVLGRENRIVRARLNALLHRLPEGSLPAPSDFMPELREEDVAPGDFALNRPDVRRAEAERDARAAELSLAKRRRLPEFTFLARYDGMEVMPEMRPMVGAGLSLPIWLGKNAASIREANAGLERKEQERLAMIDRARSEIEEARTRVQETRHEIQILETGVLPASERALTSIRAGYESNRNDFLALLNAERDLARARLDWHRANAEYGMALAEWERAIAKDEGALPEVTR